MLLQPQPEALDIDSVHAIDSSGDIAGAKSLRPVTVFGGEFQWLNNPLDEPVAGVKRGASVKTVHWWPVKRSPKNPLWCTRSVGDANSHPLPPVVRP